MSSEPQPDAPIVFGSALPGDAEVESTPEPELPPPVSVSAVPSTTNAAPVTAGSNAAASTSTAPADPAPSNDSIVAVVTTLTNGSTRTFHAKYFLPLAPGSTPRPAILDLPESYFSPTPSELQTAFAGQVKKREDLTERPLLTSKLREKEEAQKSREKAAKWPNTRIRVKFENESMIEGIFPSKDPIGAVYAFVRACLADELQDEPFVLYQSPPRREYRRDNPEFKGKNLMTLQFTPSSVFYIKFNNVSLNASKQTPPLKPELLSSPSSLPLPPTFDPTKDDSAATKPKSSGSGQKLGFGGNSGKVMPSWLKVGKK